MFFCQPDDIGSVVHQCIPNGKLWLNLIHHCDIVLKHAYTVYIYIDMCLSICVCLCRCVDWTQINPRPWIIVPLPHLLPQAIFHSPATVPLCTMDMS